MLGQMTHSRCRREGVLSATHASIMTQASTWMSVLTLPGETVSQAGVGSGRPEAANDTIHRAPACNGGAPRYNGLAGSRDSSEKECPP